jgi:hypothetical protein
MLLNEGLPSTRKQRERGETQELVDAVIELEPRLSVEAVLCGAI